MIWKDSEDITHVTEHHPCRKYPSKYSKEAPEPWCFSNLFFLFLRVSSNRFLLSSNNNSGNSCKYCSYYKPDNTEKYARIGEKSGKS